MKEFKMLIVGLLVPRAATIDVLNPATEEVLSPFSRQRSAIERGGRGDEGCRYRMVALSMERARHVLTRITDAFEARIDEFAGLLTAKPGKPLAQAREEILGSIAVLREFAKMELPLKIIRDTAEKEIVEQRTALGVVGATIPYNLPMI